VPRAHWNKFLNHQSIFILAKEEKKSELLLEFFSVSININWIHVLIDDSADGGNCFSQIGKKTDSKYFVIVISILLENLSILASIFQFRSG